MTLAAYARIWLASIRYSTVRAMMFRFDFLLWVTVDLGWIAVNLLSIEVIYRHVDAVAGWNKVEMQLLVGTGMLVMRLFMALFMTNLFAIDRHVREGTFDFFLTQPGNPLFMVSTRKIDLDGLVNAVMAAGVVVYAASRMDAPPSVLGVATYVFMAGLGLVVHYSTVVVLVSLAFWIVRVQGIEHGYWGIFDVSRLPRSAVRGPMEIAFVYVFPAVIVTNFPAEAIMHGPNAGHVAWLAAAAAAWFTVAVAVFRLGLRRYASASS
jgi:ABC-2 type transport system permease protein